MKFLITFTIIFFIFGCTQKEDEGPRRTCAYQTSSGGLGCNDSFTLSECRNAAGGRNYNFGGDSCADVRYRASYGTSPW